MLEHVPKFFPQKIIFWLSAPPRSSRDLGEILLGKQRCGERCGQSIKAFILCRIFHFGSNKTYHMPSSPVSSRIVPRWENSPARSRSSPGLPHVPDRARHEQHDGRCRVLWHDASRRRLFSVPWRRYQHLWTIRHILTRSIL